MPSNPKTTDPDLIARCRYRSRIASAAAKDAAAHGGSQSAESLRREAADWTACADFMEAADAR